MHSRVVKVHFSVVKVGVCGITEVVYCSYGVMGEGEVDSMMRFATRQW